MQDLETDTRVALLVALVERLFGPDGLYALAPGQRDLLRQFQSQPLTVHESASAIGAHVAIVERAVLALERKGLLQSASSPSGEKQYALTAVARILFDPTAARKLAPMLASRRVNDPASLDEMVSALLADLPPDVML